MGLVYSTYWFGYCGLGHDTLPKVWRHTRNGTIGLGTHISVALQPPEVGETRLHATASRPQVGGETLTVGLEVHVAFVALLGNPSTSSVWPLFVHKTLEQPEALVVEATVVQPVPVELHAE